ncbi:MAG: 8-oxo-dGTP diphosphatase [Rhabdochlamydiaceae bacterium]|nr:8-oxo-dGTP diphosphatase [Candidatus Amphrikana amoebophyrae]
MYTPIVGSLGYILSPNKKEVLLVHRTANSDDDHLGKYNGLGGKMESNEDIDTCMRREIHEEANIKVTEMELRGTINWTGFGPKGEDWLGFIFLITNFEGEPNDHSPEGPLKWIKIKDIFTLPMWEGDRYFIPLVFDDNKRPFHAFMPYENDKPLDFNYVR